MTNEEAIKVLENPDVSIGVSARIGQDPEYWRKLRPALDMAISALRQQGTVTNRNGLNDPLTLDELRQMDGEPAWFVSMRDGFASWGIVRVVDMSKAWFIAVAGAERAFGDIDGYGKTWLAFRQKPEEGTV